MHSNKHFLGLSLANVSQKDILANMPAKKVSVLYSTKVKICLQNSEIQRENCSY